MKTRFRPAVLDDSPRLLEESHRLRFQVYCLERMFLPAENYPDQLEVDGFDRHAVHVGVVDSEGKLAGTARLIKSSSLGLPLLQYCTLAAADREILNDPRNRVVEVSRLSISRHYTRR